MTTPSSLNLGLILIRADRRYCEEVGLEPTSADHLNELVRAIEANVSLPATDQVRAEMANTVVLLGRLVSAVLGEWDPSGNRAKQVSAALAEVRAVRRYLKSLHDEQEVA